MRWGILGPVLVADDAGTEIRLPGGRLRALAAALLTRANHVVPVYELAELVWRKVRGDAPFRTVSDPAYEHDVQMRVPDVCKARDVLGFEATTTLDQMLDEVIPWVREEIEAGRI